LEANRGDVLVHDVRVIHGSGPNSGPSQRRSVIIEYRSDWIRALVAANRIVIS
jgi:hypothetical protein